jgi:hypothetical protein
MSDDPNSKPELGRIPEGEPAPKHLPAPRKRVRHPSEIAATASEHNAEVRKAAFKQKTAELARLEKVVAPQLERPLSAPEDAEELQLRVDSVFKMSLVLRNPSAAVAALRLSAEVGGFIVSRAAVMSGSPDDYFLQAARTSKEIEEAFVKKLNAPHGRAYQDMLRRLERGEYDHPPDSTDDNTDNDNGTEGK